MLRLGEVAETLARRGGLEPRDVVPPAPPRDVIAADGDALERWLDAAAEWLGVEAESVATTYAEIEGALEASGPAIWRLPDDPARGRRCLAVLGGGGGALTVIGPDGGRRRIATRAVRDALTAPLVAMVDGRIQSILDTAAVAPSRRERAREVLLQKRHGQIALEGCWILRPHPGASFTRQALKARVHWLALRMIAAHAAQYGLMLAAWWTLGRGALDGRYDPGWLAAWALLLVTAIPFRLMSSWAESLLSLRVGRLLKQRLLFGTFRLRPETIRHEGSGELLGRVIESEVVESLMTTGGFSSLMAIVEIVTVGWMLAQGPGGLLHAAILASWTFVSLGAAWRYFQRRRVWTAERLGLTRELVERMVGHRTRLAQQAPERWHQGEDVSVDRYLATAKEVDHAAVTLSTSMGRGWIVVGLAGLVPAFLHTQLSPEAIAVSLGAILLADRALQKLTGGFLALGDAAIAWRVVGPLFHAASDVEPPGVPGLASDEKAALDPRAPAAPLIESHDVSYRHPGRAAPVLEGCDVAIHARDQILLEGPSGGGKSTLASVLTGLRSADSGLLLLRGLDRRTLGGSAWRRRVVSAPQFHENHIMTGSFGFNLLMGRAWPPNAEDLKEAESVCRELGLGPLLERMPSGMAQVVGETGWQLSHGERSRMYIARALLQKADLVILDESFASLDPENLDRALRCVMQRAETLLVIAHP